MSEEDVLVDISEADLVKLAEIYEQHVSWAPHVLNVINIGMKWKKSEKYGKVFTFMSPTESWREDGTFIMVAEVEGCSFYFVFTLDENCENLHKGMMKIKRLNFNGRGHFVSVNEKHSHVVNEAFKHRNMDFNELPGLMYSISLEAAKNFSLELPPDVYLNQLDIDLESVKKINSVWPHKCDGSEAYILAMIEMNGGYGLYLKSDNTLVAWVLQHCYSFIALVQTDEQHKRKGYASFLTKVLSQKLAASGVAPIAGIASYNKPSLSMFEKLGFSIFAKCSYYFDI